MMQCEALIQMIQERREYLLETIEMDKDHKLRILKVRIHFDVRKFSCGKALATTATVATVMMATASF